MFAIKTSYNYERTAFSVSSDRETIIIVVIFKSARRGESQQSKAFWALFVCFSLRRCLKDPWQVSVKPQFRQNSSRNTQALETQPP